MDNVDKNSVFVQLYITQYADKIMSHIQINVEWIVKEFNYSIMANVEITVYVQKNIIHNVVLMVRLTQILVC